MTTELQTYANNALLSKAAFADFKKYDKREDALKAAGFSEAEATDFLSCYNVKYSIHDANNSLLL